MKMLNILASKPTLKQQGLWPVTHNPASSRLQCARGHYNDKTFTFRLSLLVLCSLCSSTAWLFIAWKKAYLLKMYTILTLVLCFILLKGLFLNLSGFLIFKLSVAGSLGPTNVGAPRAAINDEKYLISPTL